MLLGLNVLSVKREKVTQVLKKAVKSIRCASVRSDIEQRFLCVSEGFMIKTQR